MSARNTEPSDPMNGSFARIPDHAMYEPGESSNHLNAFHDATFQAPSGSLPSKPAEWESLIPQSHQSSLTRAWEWQGILAKGGTPVCRACCFPVGNVLDMMFPEVLDCTEKIDLDIVPQIYYQAESARVVFFAPQSDDHVHMYNELLEYFRVNQRAGIVKLDARTTLFVVPPSEFSETVLKVPSKLCISGVVLRFDHPCSNTGSLRQPREKKDNNIISFHGETSYPVPASSLGVASEFCQVEQLQQRPQRPTDPRRKRQIGNQGNQSPETAARVEADRRERIIATLQLAVDILKQLAKGPNQQ